MSDVRFSDLDFCAAASSDAFKHRTLASIELLLKELEDRGVTVDPVTGKVTISTKPEQPKRAVE